MQTDESELFACVRVCKNICVFLGFSSSDKQIQTIHSPFVTRKTNK